MFVNFTSFLLLLISSFLPLSSEKVPGMIITLNFLRLILCPIIWFILGNVPCVLEKNAYSAADGCNVLNMPVRFIWYKVWFKFNVFFLIFFQDDPPLLELGSRTPFLLLLSISFLDLLVFALQTQLWCWVHIYLWLFYLLNELISLYIAIFLVSCYHCCHKVYF